LPYSFRSTPFMKQFGALQSSFGGVYQSHTSQTAELVIDVGRQLSPITRRDNRCRQAMSRIVTA
jgi:hypothetical protein